MTRDEHQTELALARFDRYVLVGLFGHCPPLPSRKCGCGARSLVGPVCRDCGAKLARAPEPTWQRLADERRGRGRRARGWP